MKKTALTLLTGLAIAASAQAGEDYSAKAPAPMPPAPAAGLWSWFAGGSIGYLQDADTEAYLLHVGTEYTAAGSDASHAIFLEVGYADNSESNSYGRQTSYFKESVDTSFVPVTLNYKFESVLSGNLNWFIGAGAGVAIFNADYKNSTGFKDSQSNTEFLAQVFAGLVYNVSDSFEVFGGVRYMYITDGDFNSIDTYSDDVLYELGMRFNF